MNTSSPPRSTSSASSRHETWPAGWTVRRARDAYLAENGFTVASYDDRYTAASFFGVRFKVPNTRRHRWGIMLHDLHHVATGYGTDLAGEGEISAWELRHGIRSLGPYVGGIVALGAVNGFALALRRTVAAWKHAGAPGTSLFAILPPEDDAAYAALLDSTVGELRARLGIPEAGLATRPRGLHDYAPARSNDALAA